MFELTHPVALRDEELDLVAAGGGYAPPPKHCGCGGGSLVDVDVDVDIDNQTNISGVNFGKLNQQNFG
jgi:hypothetical protein